MLSVTLGPYHLAKIMQQQVNKQHRPLYVHNHREIYYFDKQMKIYHLLLPSPLLLLATWSRQTETKLVNCPSVLDAATVLSLTVKLYR